MRDTTEKALRLIQDFRKFLIEEINGLDICNLNHIPTLLNNNIVWNMLHMNSVLYILCYKNSSIEIPISLDWVQPFSPGTYPTRIFSYTDLKQIITLFDKAIPKLKEDYTKGIFRSYRMPEQIKNIYGIELFTIEDAIAYLLHHEGIHFSTILTIKECIKKELSLK